MKKNLRVAISLLCLLFGGSGANAQMPDSVRTYVDSALYFMQTKSLLGNDVNWPTIRATTYQKAANAKTYNAAFPALTYAFQQLRDYHGMVATTDTFYRYPPPVDFNNVLSLGLKKEALKGPKIVTASLPNAVAYLRIPTMQVTKQTAMDRLANQLRDSLCLLVSKKPRGLVIDLRLNNGGNSAPMQSGISPVFHDSLLGYCVDRDGYLSSPLVLKNGVSADDKGNPLVAIQTACSVPKTTPIAVLIGPSTISSAEILALLLQQQPNVNVFGEPTPGFCSVTEGFVFGNGQGYLLLTVNRIADAQKRVCRDLIVRPDVYVKSDDNYEQLTVDPTVKAALNWLDNQSTQETPTGKRKLIIK